MMQDLSYILAAWEERYDSLSLSVYVYLNEEEQGWRSLQIVGDYLGAPPRYPHAVSSMLIQRIHSI